MCCLFRLIKVQVAKLTRNVNSEHLQEIFGLYGKVASAEVMMDPTVELSKGVAYVQFEAQADAEKAVAGLEGVTSPPPSAPLPAMFPPFARAQPPAACIALTVCAVCTPG